VPHDLFVELISLRGANFRVCRESLGIPSLRARECGEGAGRPGIVNASRKMGV
jgi:hypothetical protein